MHLFTLKSAIFADGLCIVSVLAFIIVLVLVLIFKPIQDIVNANAFHSYQISTMMLACFMIIGIRFTLLISDNCQ